MKPTQREMMRVEEIKIDGEAHVHIFGDCSHVILSINEQDALREWLIGFDKELAKKGKT